MALGVFKAAPEGDARAGPILDDVIDLLALAAGNISSIIDPELIVVGGSVVQSLEAIIERVRQRLVGRVPHPPRIAQGLLGRDAVLAGAAALAIERTADYAFVQVPDGTTARAAAIRPLTRPRRRKLAAPGA